MRLIRQRFVDGQRLAIGNVVVRLKVNPRARRVSLRIDRLGREAIAVAPSSGRLAEAAAFAEARRIWLAEHLARAPAVSPAAPGDCLQLFGAPCRLEPDGRRPRIIPACGDAPARLLGCGDGEVDLQLVARAIKRQAFGVYQARIGSYCARLGVPAPLLFISDAKTRWGSCSPARRGAAASIRLSWRLALAPIDVADYVVAHECAHLLEPNHSPRFWAVVHGLVGDEKRHRAWLRAHGSDLHAFGC